MNPDELKKFLSPDSEVCPICNKTISGTQYDRAEHVAHCQAILMQQELEKAKRAQEIRDGLKKELKKLV